MKKIICAILLFCFISNPAFACDWSTIKQLPDGGFEYSAAQNLCVGKLVQDAKVKDQQIADLNQAISLKSLALTDSDARTQLWMNTSSQELDRLNKISSDEKRNDWTLFALGALTVVASGFMAAKLIHN